MNVENYIKDTLKEQKIHLTLLDPEEQTPEEAVGYIAKAAVSGGSDGIMLGGSTTDSART